MKQHRDVGGHGGLGDRRYERYCAAFDRAEQCIQEGYFLDANRVDTTSRAKVGKRPASYQMHSFRSSAAEDHVLRFGKRH